MEKKLKILVIDSDEAIAAELEEKVKQLGFESCSTASPDLPIDQIEALSPELAILGASLDAEACLKCMHKLKILDSSMPVLISCPDLCLPGGSFKAPFDGIFGITPGYEPNEISQIIERSIENKGERERMLGCPVLIGQSREMMDIRDKIQVLAGKDITVLITGETGTGKELIARSIHLYSPRHSGPMVKINCAAIPAELLESEVFGFQKGAFTGAYKPKPGQLEMASGGTLFIDEIGALPLSLQAKFLQILEDKEFSRLGGINDKLIDIRSVVATNADLRKMVHERTFREDLYYRLNIMHIKVSPLRDRKEDIPLLIDYYMNKYCFELKRTILDIPDYVNDFLLTYRWPGNVRELENVIKRAIVLQAWNFLFDELHLVSETPEREESDSPTTRSPLPDWPDEQMKKVFEDSDFSLKKIAKDYVSEAERQMFLGALKETKWNRKKAAKLLGVSYKTLLNRIDEFDLKP